MMNKKGMLVICGNSVAELEKELEMLKMAVSTGAVMGCGGSTIGGVEQALKALTSAVGVDTPPIISQCNCECGCCCCNCEEGDEDEICPICGDILEDILMKTRKITMNPPPEPSLPNCRNCWKIRAN